MWSSEQDSNTTNPRNHTPLMGTSNSSSPRSSLSSSNGSMIFPQTPRRSMEDVWKDISLMTPLQNQYHQHHHHHHQYNHHHQSHQYQNHFQLTDPNGSYKGMILQDFLSGPSNRSLAVSPPVDHNTAAAAAAAVALPPIIDIAPNLPPTSLSLNSGLDFGCLGNSPSSNSSSGDSKAGGHRATETSFVSPANYPDMIIDPSLPVNILSFYSKKRVPDGPPVGSDRRQKRMIKNRESAARSRARKQAYTSTLEQNVNNLTQENEMLQNQCNELRLAMERQQSTRSSLQRCGSCSF